MKALNIFLKALEGSFGKEKRGTYIVKANSLPTITPYIKKHNIEVWLVDGKNIQLIAEQEEIANNEEYNEDIHIQKVITKILKYYGL